MNHYEFGFERIVVGFFLVIAGGCGVNTAQDDVSNTADSQPVVVEEQKTLSDRPANQTNNKTLYQANDAQTNDVQDVDSDDKPRIRVKMPGESFQGTLPELTDEQLTIRDTLRRDLTRLAGVIGERNVDNPDKYVAAAQFIEKALSDAGYKVERHSYRVGDESSANLIATVAGHKKADEIVVIGAHYDTLAGTPGANDNGSGVVATLALARMFEKQKLDRSLRFVFFANEEPPYFQTENMGSLVYAKLCKARGDNIVAMISVETIGYYSDEAKSQNYPPPFSEYYPSTGNFVAFVGNTKSHRLVATCVGSFRKHVKFPSEGGAMPSSIAGVGWSDHWSFWQVGYPALMVTDTAPYRYPHYHRASDTPDKIDFDRMSRVVTGLRGVVSDLTNSD